jgi:hypothetical protein
MFLVYAILYIITYTRKYTMASSRQDLPDVRRLLKEKAVFLLNEVVTLLACSSRWAHHRLKQWGALRSYNQNGRYYVLPETPQFDQFGLWHHEKASFSRHGNLTHTVRRLILDAPAGLTGRELGNRLRLEPRSFLHHFRNHLDLSREKFGGVYVYVAAEPERRQAQLEARQALEVTEISDSQAVQLLVCLIKHPDSTPFELARRLRQSGISLSPETIAGFLAAHDLGKKTPAAER